MVTVPLWLPPRHPPGLSQAPSSATHGYPSSSSPLLYLSLRSDQDPQQQLLFGRGSSSACLGLGSPSVMGPAVPQQLLEGKPWQGKVALSPKGSWVGQWSWQAAVDAAGMPLSQEQRCCEGRFPPGPALHCSTVGVQWSVHAHLSVPPVSCCLLPDTQAEGK